MSEDSAISSLIGKIRQKEEERERIDTGILEFINQLDAYLRGLNRSISVRIDDSYGFTEKIIVASLMMSHSTQREVLKIEVQRAGAESVPSLENYESEIREALKSSLSRIADSYNTGGILPKPEKITIPTRSIPK